MVNLKKTICIIGGGFYGSYIAKKIKEDFKNFKVEIYEKNSDLITQAGKNNQYRLHLGFHYPRSQETINQTQKGSKIFTKEFKKFIFKIKKNIYLIHKKSILNFSEYKSVFRNKKIYFKELDLKKFDFLKNKEDFQGAINTEEQVILLDKLIPFLKKKVKEKCKVYCNQEIKEIISKTTEIILNQNKKKKFDYIINCTYTNPNLGLKKKYSIKYEIAAMLKVYTNIKNTALTIMDGPFISIYPRNSEESSISSVIFTPQKKFRNLKDLEKNLIKTKKNKKNIQKKIIGHLKNYFNDKIKIINKGIIIAPKVKILNDKKSERVTMIKKNHNVISVLCGKLDAAPLAYRFIKNIVKN